MYKDRADEAFQILVKYHAEAGRDTNARLFHFEMAEIRASLAQEKLTHAAKWTEYFKSKGMRHWLATTIIVPMSLQWCGNALISYYFPIVLSTFGLTDPIVVLVTNIGNSAFSLTA